MDCVDDNQPNFKHYCRVCKRGFMCGRALGGHMRAHGIGDENAMNLDDDDDDDNNNDDDDQTCDWGDEKNDNGNGNKKKMYKLRTNPNRLKSCKNCEHCGEEFVSWKSFLEHGKCGYEDGSESLVSAPAAESEDEDNTAGGGGRTRWSKRKRSMRSEVLAGGGNNNNCIGSGENNDFLLAACLVQLANTVVDLPSEPEESCASASREEEIVRNNNNATFFASTATHKRNMRNPADKGKGIVVSRNSNNKGMFECKACKKVFNSHQALGGHRASHKKVKGCYAARQDQLEDNNNNNLTVREDDVAMNNDSLYLPSKENTSSHQFDPGSTLSGPPDVRRKSKVHECSICHRVFSSGQALGGHKRCHWITSNSLDPASPKLNFHHQQLSGNHEPKVESDAEQQLDLNVPVWATMSGLRRDPVNPLSFDVPTDVNVEPRLLDGGSNNVEDNKGSNRESQQTRPKNNEAASEKVNNVEKGETNNGGDRVEDDEADSSVKFDKMADLKDMETNGDSSKWLQVGICSSTAAADS